MPYDLRKRGSEWCVIKRTDGKSMGCHESRAKAERQRRAIQASEASAEGSTVPAMNLHWEAVLAIEGHPTSDRRFLMPGEIVDRELPLSLMVMTVTAEGHEGAELGGKIEQIDRMTPQQAAALELLSEEQLANLTEGAVVIVGRGVFDDSDFGHESARQVDEEFLRGVSADLAITALVLLDADTFEPVDTEDMEIEDLLAGDFLTGIKAEIGGATVVPFPAFSEAKIRMWTGAEGPIAVVASGFAMKIRHEPIDHSDNVFTVPSERRHVVLTAAGAPLKPPRSWFEDPGLRELTPLTICADGRVYGHLADWDGCHTGFSSMCVPPFRSNADYAYFNTGEIETAEAALIPCGKLMFSMDGGKHAPLDPKMSAAEVSKHYDDATKVGAYIRAGSDRFGTWLAGVLRPDLSEAEVQHLRLHPPSGDWRPIPGKGTELVAAFCVPVGGFPIARAMAASGELAFITAPLEIEPMGPREFRRKKRGLWKRSYALLGPAKDDEAA